MTAPVDTPTSPRLSAVTALLPWLLPLGGLLLSLAFPNEVLPGRLGDHPPAWLAWLALLPLWWAVLTLPPQQAWRSVWLYGLLFALGTLSWMRLFGLLPWALLALYLSLVPLLAYLIAQRLPLPRWLLPLGFALAWSGLEWLRGQGLFGFVWSEVGMSQVDGVTARLASLGGTSLITFLMLWTTGTLVLRLRERTTPRWLLPAAAGVFGVLLLAGWLQVQATTRRWHVAPGGQTLSVVQPNALRGLVPAALVHGVTLEERQQRLDTLMALSRQATTQRRALPTDAAPQLVIWPESALPDPPYDPVIADFCRLNASYLLAGAPYYRYDVRLRQLRTRNTAFLFTPRGVEEGRYSKIHLVPFGEFVPLRPLVQKYYTVRENDLQRGERWAPLMVSTHPVGVGICFESTFPDIARTYARQRAGLLIYITNDAWFHQTSAVRQHFNHARFRALETGLPVARAASTGISGFIAPDGRILAEIPTYTQGVRTRYLPDGIPGTLTSHGGWLFGPLCLAMTLLLLLVSLGNSRRKSPKSVTSR